MPVSVKHHAERDNDPAAVPAFCECSTRALRADDGGYIVYQVALNAPVDLIGIITFSF